jgi:hypothetical protein
MHAKNFCSEILVIFKNNFRPAGTYAAGTYVPMSQSGFPIVEHAFVVLYANEVWQGIKS